MKSLVRIHALLCMFLLSNVLVAQELYVPLQDFEDVNRMFHHQAPAANSWLMAHAPHVETVAQPLVSSVGGLKTQACGAIDYSHLRVGTQALASDMAMAEACALPMICTQGTLSASAITQENEGMVGVLPNVRAQKALQKAMPVGDAAVPLLCALLVYTIVVAYRHRRKETLQ